MDAPRSNTALQVSIRTLLEITAVVAVILALFFTRDREVASPSSRYHYLQSERWGLIVYDSETGAFWQKTDTGWFRYDGPTDLGK